MVGINDTKVTHIRTHSRTCTCLLHAWEYHHHYYCYYCYSHLDFVRHIWNNGSKQLIKRSKNSKEMKAKTLNRVWVWVYSNSTHLKWSRSTLYCIVTYHTRHQAYALARKVCLCVCMWREYIIPSYTIIHTQIMMREHSTAQHIYISLSSKKATFFYFGCCILRVCVRVSFFVRHNELISFSVFPDPLCVIIFPYLQLLCFSRLRLAALCWRWRFFLSRSEHHLAFAFRQTSSRIHFIYKCMHELICNGIWKKRKNKFCFSTICS